MCLALTILAIPPRFYSWPWLLVGISFFFLAASLLNTALTVRWMKSRLSALRLSGIADGKSGLKDASPMPDLSHSNLRPSRIVTLGLSRIVPLAVMFILGYGTHAIRQFKHVQSFQMHVIKRAEPYGYVVQIDGGKPTFFYVCQNMPDPEFEAGEKDRVVAEYQGSCYNLSDDGFGYVTERDSNGQIIHTGGQ